MYLTAIELQYPSDQGKKTAELVFGSWQCQNIISSS